MKNGNGLPMVQNSTLFVKVDFFGDKGEVSVEDPESYSLSGIVPDPLLTDVRDEVVQRILEYARNFSNFTPLPTN
jgi:hypothetical protein